MKPIEEFLQVQFEGLIHHASLARRLSGLPGMAFLAIIFGAVQACGSTIRDDQPDSLYLNLALQPQYGCVGTFVNDWGYTGSATLIAPDWVLTGAHMFAAASSGTFTINGVGYSASQLISHPSWRSSNKLAGYDFGLAHLSTPVTSVTPVALYTGSSELGQVGTFVGYGMTGTGLTGYRSLDNKERAFQNVIDGDFGNPSLVLGSDFDNPHSAADSAFGDPTPLALEGAVAPGDSGGGVFLDIGGTTYLAGVISFIAATDGSANSDYGDLSGFGRISAVAPWIVNTVPEPSISTLLFVGLGLFGWRQSRRAQG